MGRIRRPAEKRIQRDRFSQTTRVNFRKWEKRAGFTPYFIVAAHFQARIERSVGQKVRKAGIGRKSFLRKEGKKRLFVQKIGIINKSVVLHF
jgi:uncharacterized protein YmfQ (DUF2313 family)